MKYISTIIILILFSSILDASYLRTIRIGAFSTDQKAQESLVRLEKYFKSNENLVELQKKYEFELKARTSGKYYATLIEPFTSRVVLQEVLDTLRLEYKDAYVTNLKVKPTEKKETIEVKKVDKKIEVKRVEKQVEVIAPKVIRSRVEKNEPEVKTEIIKENLSKNKDIILSIPVYY